MGYVKRVAAAYSLPVLLFIGISFAGCAALKSLEPLAKEAGAGAAAGAAAAGRDAAYERLDKAAADGKLDPATAEGLKAIVDAIPAPAAPAPSNEGEKGIVYGIAFLVAKILGDSLKGLVRRKLDKQQA